MTPLPVASLMLAAFCAANAPTPRHLFLDPGAIEISAHVALHVHPPQRREIVIRPDRPWEQLMISFYLTLLDEERKLRMWYVCRDRANHPGDLPDPNALPFQYTADRVAGARHPDTTPPRRLADQIWGRAASESVQFDDDVNITVDLGAVHDVDKLRVRAYERTARGGYQVGKVTVSISDDKIHWKPLGQMGKPTPGPEELVTFSTALALRTRYVRLFFEKALGTRRMLLGEIEVTAPSPDSMKAIRTQRPWPRPMHVKQTLDRALLAAAVPFLYNCPVTDVLYDAEGKLCGIVMANRAGRQAVIVKTIIDATERAIVARLAGAAQRPYPAGMQTFRRVVIGGEVQHAPGMTARTIGPPFIGSFPNQAKTRSGLFPIIEYTMQLPLVADTVAAWAAADRQARGMTYHPEQQFTSDVLFQAPPDSIYGQASATGPWSGVDSLPLGAFRPCRVDRLLVLGGCADIPRPQAEKLLRPLALIDLGVRLGKEAAAEAKSCSAPQGAMVRGTPIAPPAEPGDVAELLAGVRPGRPVSKIPSQARALPGLGRYDVVVAGGGTSGAPAGIAAARKKAKTLVVEQLCGLGGVGTLGAISTYCSGNRVGFTAEVAGGPSWVIEQKMEWWRTTLLKAGADIWFGATACGAFVDGGQVRGLVVVTPSGRGVVLAKVVVDATGNADVAAAAGAACVDTDASEFAMQGTGLPGRKLGATYTNTDYTYTDETDLVDVWHLMVSAKVLGMLGEATGLETLLAEVNQAQGWDATPDWRLDKEDPLLGLVGWITSHLDNTLMAIGRTGRAEAVPAAYKQMGCLHGIARAHGCELSCSKSVRIIEEFLLGFLTDVLLTEAFIEERIAKASTYLEQEAQKPQVNTAPLKSKIRATEGKLKKLFERIEDETDEDLCKAYDKRIKGLQKDLNDQHAALRSAERQNGKKVKSLDSRRAKQFLASMRALLNQEVPMAAEAIRTLTGPIKIRQEPNPGRKKGARWIATFSPDFTRLLQYLAKGNPELSGLVLTDGAEPQPIEVVIDKVPKYEKLAPLFKQLRDNGASVGSIAHAHGMCRPYAEEILEFADTGKRPQWGSVKRRGVGRANPNKYREIGPDVVRMRDVQLMSFPRIAKALRVGRATVERAYDNERPEAVREAAEKGQKPRRGRFTRLPAKVFQEIRKLLSEGMKPPEVAKQLGCGVSTVCRERLAMKDEANGDQAV